MKSGVDYIGIGAGAILRNERGQILLLHKSDAEDGVSPRWTIPGGEVLFGERLEEAVEREVAEESCLQVKRKRLVDYFEFFNDGKHWISFIFLVEAFEGVPRIGEPLVFQDIGWFNQDMLPELNSITRITIARYFREIHV